MAHSCPDCDSICYCGGDIDDLCFEDTEEQDRCTHYKKCQPDDDDEEPEEYDDAPDTTGYGSYGH